VETPIATVISIRDNLAVVEVDAAAVCARCAAGKGCGAGLLSGGRRPGRLEVNVGRDRSLQIGERVYLSLEPANILRASLLAYGLPLLGVTAALALAWLLSGRLADSAAVVIALAGLGAGLVLGRWQMRRLDCLRQLVPTIGDRVISGPGRVPE